MKCKENKKRNKMITETEGLEGKEKILREVRKRGGKE